MQTIGETVKSKRRLVPVDQIAVAQYNPRRALRPGDVEYEKLKKSIEEFGLVEDLVWNERTGTLVGGHQRLAVLKEKGVKEVEVNVVDLDEKRERALNIALNKITGEWDKDKLKEIIVELDDGEFDIEMTGFLEPEIEELIREEIKEMPKNFPEMELQAFEHYDYVVLLFQNSMDFLAAVERLGLKKVEFNAGAKARKVGVGRAIDGKKALEILCK